MFSRQISTTLTLTALLILATGVASAQSTTRPARGWAARAAQRSLSETRETAKVERMDTGTSAQELELQTAMSTGSQDVLERYKEGRRRALIGAWRVHIPVSATGLPPFNALHTFHQGGTFNEVSDLLPGLAETPAVGVWDLDGYRFLLTFELFVFDENKQPAGIIRVRASIDVYDADHLRGDTIVDFIAPDGTEILDIDRGPFTGTRIRPLFLGN